jgi:hypothetical protein
MKTFLTIADAMSLCGCTDRTGFLRSCSRLCAPIVHLNARTVSFEAESFKSWLDSLDRDDEWWRSTDQ